MTLFTPPTTDGLPTADPSKNDVNNRHWRWYESWAMGKTVWRDSLGAWHEAIFPYQGGGRHRTFDKGVLITETVESSVNNLADAQKVYLGGHVYELTSQEETDLVAAGYGSRINVEPVTLSWETNELRFLSRREISDDPPNVPADPVVEGNQGVFRMASGDVASASGQRDWWLHTNTSGWTDVEATCACIDPPHYGDNYQGSGINVLPQGGVVLRAKFDGSKWRGITLNNNIFFVVPWLNVGVWEANADGTGFANRQFGWPLEEMLPFPYGFRARLVSNVITVSIFQKDGTIFEDDPTKTKTINLDTDAGDAGLIPTPTGAGQCGVIAAHLGTSPFIAVRLGRTDFTRIT